MKHNSIGSVTHCILYEMGDMIKSEDIEIFALNKMARGKFVKLSLLDFHSNLATGICF